MASIIKVDQLSEKTQGSGITLSHSLKNSSGSEIISPSGTVSNLSKLSLTPSSAPSSPVQGDIYLDSSDYNLKIYNGISWKNIINAGIISATGGTVTDITDNGINYRVHTFTTSGTFTVTENSGEVECLVVAGGGGGGEGGGGAGGMITLSSYFLPKGDHIITIGAGGAGYSFDGVSAGDSGSPTIAFSQTALGGGQGSHDSTSGASGGSGGGGRRDGGSSGGLGTSGQGNAGGTTTSGPWMGAAGGGGKGDKGQGGSGGSQGSEKGGDGGVGESWHGTYYAGGGGGGTEGSGGYGAGGNGGGGRGYSKSDNGLAASGTANSGGGGGGRPHTGGVGPAGSGGSGIVIIRYQI